MRTTRACENYDLMQFFYEKREELGGLLEDFWVTFGGLLGDFFKK